MHVKALFDQRRRDALKGAVASGDLGPVLKKRAEALGTPNLLSVFIPKSSGVPMDEAIRRADEAGVVIASNKKIDSLLTGNGLESIKDVFPCWTGTMTGYVEPGKTFREAGEWSDSLKCHVLVYVDKIIKTRYLFPIPEEHLDKKDSILIVNHPGFTLEREGKDRIVRAARVNLIERFPAANGQYLTDPHFGIPFGLLAPDGIGSLARILHRQANRVGFVVRSDYGPIDLRGHVILDDAAGCDAYGVVVEQHGAKG